eukprot:NODE_705_length_4578_cov_0.471087.p3 type:complete len:259 gc:universal NODE_705_length_4578_cov_0.471087:890-114(-)
MIIPQMCLPLPNTLNVLNTMAKEHRFANEFAINEWNHQCIVRDRCHNYCHVVTEYVKHKIAYYNDNEMQYWVKQFKNHEVMNLPIFTKMVESPSHYQHQIIRNEPTESFMIVLHHRHAYYQFNPVKSFAVMFLIPKHRIFNCVDLQNNQLLIEMHQGLQDTIENEKELILDLLKAQIDQSKDALIDNWENEFEKDKKMFLKMSVDELLLSDNMYFHIYPHATIKHLHLHVALPIRQHFNDEKLKMPLLTLIQILNKLI